MIISISYLNVVTPPSYEFFKSIFKGIFILLSMYKNIIFIGFFGFTVLTTQSVVAIEKPISFNIKQDTNIRIVSLSPASTEMLFDLQLGHFIVGTTQHSDYPKAAQDIKRIGPYQRPNLEMILGLKPTLVIAVSEGVDTVSPILKRANIPLIVLNTKSLLDFEKNIRILSKVFNIVSRGQELIKKWKDNWAKIPVLKKQINVIVQVDQNPLILAGQQTHLNEVIERCGALNVFKVEGYQKVSRETLANLEPDKILTFRNLDRTMTKSKIVNYWKSYPLLKNTPVQFFDPRNIGRLTLRLSSIASQVCQKIKS